MLVRGLEPRSYEEQLREWGVHALQPPERKLELGVDWSLPSNK